jgi:hypothetical protein
VEPNTARNEADEARRAAEAASPSGTEQTEPEQPNTQSKPDINIGDDEDEDEDEDEDKDDDYLPPTEEQTAAVKGIMMTKKTDPYGRLGLEQGSAHVLQGFIDVTYRSYRSSFL